MITQKRLTLIIVLTIASLVLNVYLYNKYYYTSSMLETTLDNLESKYFSELRTYSYQIKRLREGQPEQLNLLWGLSNNLAMTASYYQQIPKDHIRKKMGERMFNLALYLHQISGELNPEDLDNQQVIEERITEVDGIYTTTNKILINIDIPTNEKIENWIDFVDSIEWTKDQ